MNQVIKELWEEYKKAVIHGHGAETKRILIKIYELRDSLAPKE